MPKFFVFHYDYSIDDSWYAPMNRHAETVERESLKALTETLSEGSYRIFEVVEVASVQVHEHVAKAVSIQVEEK